MNDSFPTFLSLFLTQDQQEKANYILQTNDMRHVAFSKPTSCFPMSTNLQSEHTWSFPFLHYKFSTLFLPLNLCQAQVMMTGSFAIVSSE